MTSPQNPPSEQQLNDFWIKGIPLSSKLCKIGYCGRTGARYAGGEGAPAKIDKGICPICGSPAIKGREE